MGCKKEETALEQCMHYESTKLRLQPEDLTTKAIKRAGYIHYISGLEGKLIAYAKHKGFTTDRRFNEIAFQMQNEPKAAWYYERYYALATSDVFEDTYRALSDFDNYLIAEDELDASLLRCKEREDCAVKLNQWEQLQSTNAPIYLPQDNIFTDTAVTIDYENIEQSLVSTLFDYVSNLEESDWIELVPSQLKTRFMNMQTRLSGNERERILTFLEFMVRVPYPKDKRADSAYMHQKQYSDFYSSSEYVDALLLRFNALIRKPTLEDLAALTCHDSIELARN